MKTLEIKNLHVSVEGKEILKGINLTVRQGEIHTIMGPNGSGKSTLSNAIMGNPKYQITQGQIIFDNVDITSKKPHERAKLGLFLAFQYPTEIQGVTLQHFLFTVYRALQANGQSINRPTPQMLREFKANLTANMEKVALDPSFSTRYLNVGLSGGEKKRAEILQLLMLNPALAVLDETDSGLDIDSLKIIAEAVNEKRGAQFGALVITHYQRILNHLHPDYVHVLMDGKIVKSGGIELAQALEQKGYEWLEEQVKEQRVVA